MDDFNIIQREFPLLHRWRDESPFPKKYVNMFPINVGGVFYGKTKGLPVSAKAYNQAEAELESGFWLCQEALQLLRGRPVPAIGSPWL